MEGNYIFILSYHGAAEANTIIKESIRKISNLISNLIVKMESDSLITKSNWKQNNNNMNKSLTIVRF